MCPRPTLVFVCSLLLVAGAYAGPSTGGRNAPAASGTSRVRIEERFVHPAFVADDSGARGSVRAAKRATSVHAKLQAGSACFDNDRYAGIVYDMLPNQELVDWGTKACGTGTVETLTYGMQTTNLAVEHGGPGHRIGLRLFAGATGGAPGQLGTLVAEYTLQGDYGTPPGGLLATAFLQVTLPTPLALPDGPFAWSYFSIESATDPTMVLTDGAPCAGGAADPVTGTYDCLGDWNYPAGGPGGFFFASVRPAAGHSSLFLRLNETDAVVASATPRSAAANPDVYTADAPTLGATWNASVDTSVTGHDFALVFGFDSPSTLPLGGGQVLLALDLGGSGEQLAQSIAAGPLASFTATVPTNPALAGAEIYTQAVLLGGVVPFALSNAVDLVVGTP